MMTAGASSAKAEPLAQRRAQARRRGIRIDRQQDHGVGRGVRGVDPRVGADESVRRFGDDQTLRPCARCAAPRATRFRSCADPCPIARRARVASGEGSIVRRSTTCPSAFDTILWVTTTMSPRSSRSPDASMASAISAGRSSPGRTSGISADADDADLAAVTHPTLVAHDASDNASVPRQSTVRCMKYDQSSGVSRSNAIRASGAPQPPSRGGAPLPDAWPGFRHQTQT